MLFHPLIDDGNLPIEFFHLIKIIVLTELTALLLEASDALPEVA